MSGKRDLIWLAMFRLNMPGNVIFLILLSCLNLFPMVPGRWLILALVLGSREWCWL